MSEKNGGSAFPNEKVWTGCDHSQYHPGMSLRDWFAGQALANPAFDAPVETVAAWAWAQADDMLKERDK